MPQSERGLLMKVNEIREKARALGIGGTARLRKGDLIRRIQRAEGNFDCFGSAGRFHCPQADCCWRADCLTPAPS